MKIAMVCSGVGRVQRGFERLFLDIFDLLKDELDVTLFKGGGTPSARERVVWNLPRHGRLVRLLPLHKLRGRPPYWTECWTFGLAVFPKLLAGGFDVVHYIDLPMGAVLARLRRLFRAKFRLLYTQGVVVDPKWYPPADHLHQIAKVLIDDAVEKGIPRERMTLVPCGFHARRFVADEERRPALRAAARARLGIPPERFVILSVAALNRVQKRVDAVIEEVATVDGDLLLWLDGQPEDATLVDLAKARLGDRVRVTRVPSNDVADLYHAADLFVLGSFEESFGIAVVEAMASGLPVLTHDSPHFEWLLGSRDGLVDLRVPGRLAEGIRRLRADAPLRHALGQRNAASAASRFDWSVLKPAYAALFARAGDPGS